MFCKSINGKSQIHNIYASDLWDSGVEIILDNSCYGIIVENNIVYNASSGWIWLYAKNGVFCILQ